MSLSWGVPLGGGGSGGITHLTSTGGTITVTDPTGPTTNVDVAAGIYAPYQGPGTLLARLQYAPASQALISTASATLATIDATHLTIPFTAPPSGDVLVRLVAACQGNWSSTNYGYWALLDHTAHTQVGFTVTVCAWPGPSSSSESNYVNGLAEFLITGLVAGTAYQYDWAFATSGANFYVLPAGQTSGAPTAPQAAPALMQVWAA